MVLLVDQAALRQPSSGASPCSTLVQAEQRPRLNISLCDGLAMTAIDWDPSSNVKSLHGKARPSTLRLC